MIYYINIQKKGPKYFLSIILTSIFKLYVCYVFLSKRPIIGRCICPLYDDLRNHLYYVAETFNGNFNT